MAGVYFRLDLKELAVAVIGSVYVGSVIGYRLIIGYRLSMAGVYFANSGSAVG